MTGTRGPRSRILPTHPNWVLTKAMKTGLSTAVYLQRTIKTKSTSHLYTSSRDILLRASEAYYTSKKHGQPEFNHIRAAEHNIRKNGLDMLEEISAAYGNKETVRIKNRFDEVGPLNQRLNIGGSALREFGMCRYPFSDSHILKDKHDNELGVGYPAHSRAPYYLNVHTTLPELDFVDSVRTHIQLLDTHCTIYDVPNRDTRYYNNLLLLRMRPYLDYIYTEHQLGDGGFRAGTIKVLRDIKDDISKNYQIRIGTSPSVTSSTSSKVPIFSMEFFDNQYEEAKTAGVVYYYLDELDRIRTKGSIISENDDGKPAPCLTANDVAHLWNLALKKSRTIGSQVHHQISQFFDGFWSAKGAILSDETQAEDEAYRIVSEIPLKTVLGKGRADLTLFQREATPTGLQTVHRPTMVVEIKTKTGFEWDFYPKQKWSESRKQNDMKQRIVPEFLVRTRKLNDIEWNSVINSTPNQDTDIQLETYAQSLSDAFSSITSIQNVPPILRATIILDSSDINYVTEEMIRKLIISAYETARNNPGFLKRTLFEVSMGEENLNLAIVLHEQEFVSDYNDVPIPSPWQPIYNPLYGSGHNKRNFILYLSSASPISAGKSAGWIARYYHGFQYISQLYDKNRNSEILWIDLADDFIHSSLTRARLRIYENDEALHQSENILDILDAIRFEGLFSRVQRFLFEDESIPSIDKLTEFTEEQPIIIIVNGWDTINESTPLSNRIRLNRLLTGIIDQIPDADNITVLWFDSPTPDVRRSAIYRSRCLFPFFDTSPLFGEVTKIVWNLPTAPTNEVDPDSWNLPTLPNAPMYDDVRVLITQDSNGIESELIHIPPLMGWSARFRAEQYDKSKVESPRTINQSVPNVTIRERLKLLGFTLLPWITKLWPDYTVSLSNETKTISDALEHIMKARSFVHGFSIISRTLANAVSDEPSLLQRMKYRPSGPSGLKTILDLGKSKINSQRLYRKSAQLKTDPRSSYTSTTEVDIQNKQPLLYGQIITSSNSDEAGILVVIESQVGTSTLAIGLFAKSSGTDANGFEWTERNLGNKCDEIRKLLVSGTRTNLAMMKVEDKLIAWEKKPDEDIWSFHGILELRVGAKSGSIGVLRAVKRTASTEQLLIPDTYVPDYFSERVSRAVERLLQLHEESEPVTAHLSWVTDGCLTEFKNTDSENVHEAKYLGTADLVKTLAITKRGLPVTLASGQSMFWDCYHEINYGELSLATTITESYVSRDVTIHLPSRLDDLQSLPEEIPVEVELSHDMNICPLFLGTDVSHARCWKIQSVSDNPIVSATLDGNYTDREVLLILGPTKAIIDNSIYPLDVRIQGSLQHKEGMPLRESSLIMKLVRKLGVRLTKLPPGTYLQTPTQKWRLDIESSDDWLTWVACSTLTGEYWRGKSFTFELDFSYKLSEAENELWTAITREIPITEIENPNELRTLIGDKLELRGFSDDTHDVRLEIVRSGRSFTETLRKADDSGTILNVRIFTITPQDSIEGILDDVYFHLSDGILSEYDVVNKTEYLEELKTLLDDLVE